MGNGLRLWTPRKTGGIMAWLWTTRRFIGERVGLVDSAREENKARAVAEIYRIPLKRGRYHRLPPL